MAAYLTTRSIKEIKQELEETLFRLETRNKLVPLLLTEAKNWKVKRFDIRLYEALAQVAKDSGLTTHSFARREEDWQKKTIYVLQVFAKDIVDGARDSLIIKLDNHDIAELFADLNRQTVEEARIKEHRNLIASVEADHAMAERVAQEANALSFFYR